MRWLGAALALLPAAALHAGPLDSFANAARDSGQSPYIERLLVSLTDTELVLRFEGTLDLGRRTGVRRAGTDEPYHHADHTLIVTLDNEALEAYSLTVGPGPDGGALVVWPAEASVASDARGVELRIALDRIRCSPLEISAQTHAVYYLTDAGMMATEGRNLFAVDGGAARVEIASLGPGPGPPQVLDVAAESAGAGTTRVRWRTDTRTTGEVTLAKPDGTPRTERQMLRLREHQVTLPGLDPGTTYVATVGGTDFAGRSAPPRAVRFDTAPSAEGPSSASPWLQVQGKFLVDSGGRPFALGGYAHYVGEYWFNEFPRYGTTALAARYFRSIGFNACRLGLVERKEQWWSASIMNDGSAFERYGGPEGFVRELVRPLVDQIVAEGIYVVLDWHWSYGLRPEDLERTGRFWEACAAQFKEEPGVAIYQLLNEPGFEDGQTRPDLAPRIRDLTKDYIGRIRRHDRRHVILVPDWNCGWGWATESQWAPVNFDPGDPQRQIVYSKHIAGEHATEAFMAGGVDAVADRWDVPILFDEVEIDPLMSVEQTAWFFRFLRQNPRNYGFLLWVCGQYSAPLAELCGPFATAYLRRPPFGAAGSDPIAQWWRLADPQQSEHADHWRCRYRLAEPLPAGDYALVAEHAPLGARLGVAIAPVRDAAVLLGTWLGAPRQALWSAPGGYLVAAGASAINRAVYFHALEPFGELVVRLDQAPADASYPLQLLRLNPAHQMPVPRIESAEVR